MKRDIVVPDGGVTLDWAQRLFEQSREAGIPISLSVPFLVRARGWQIAEFCAELEVHRGYFNALLKGQYGASMGIRLGVRQRLGFDPWRGSDAVAPIFHPGEHDRPQQEGAVR